MANWGTLRERLADRTERKPFWDKVEARDAFNEALSLWNLLVGEWRGTATVATSGSVARYALPSTLLYRTRVLYNGAPLTSSSREELNLARPRWRAETTASGGDVPSTVVAWAPISLGLIYIWPAPFVGGGTLTLEGVSATPIVVEDADVVVAPDHLFETLLGFALHVLSFKKGGAAFAATRPLFQTLLQEAAEQNSLIKTSTLYRRVMGLDRRDLKPLRGVPTALDALASGGGNR